MRVPKTSTKGEGKGSEGPKAQARAAAQTAPAPAQAPDSAVVLEGLGAITLDPDARPSAGGLRRRVRKAERLKRRAVMLRLLETGVDRSEVERVMGDQFGMTHAAAGALAAELLNGIASTEAERRPHFKRLQLRRLLGYIATARAAKDRKGNPRPNWTAIAHFEKLYAQVAGTLEPVEIRANVDVQVREAVLLAVEQMPPARLAQLADRARLMRALPELPPAARPVLEVPAA